MIKVEPPVERGTVLEVERDQLPPTGDDEYYAFELVGLEVAEESGRALGTVKAVTPGVANDVLELDTGVLLPMVEDCVQQIDLDAAAHRRRGRVRRVMQLDVFTLVPHAFAWLTEQRPVATVLGDELDLRLFSYRDFTPLRSGQVDDEPYGGGAGMVLRVDVVAAALEAVYEERPSHPVIALTPQGRQLTQAVVEELAPQERVTLLSARFEGFDERIVWSTWRPTRSRSGRTCSRTATCRRWCSSTRSPAGSPARSAKAPARSSRSPQNSSGALEYPHYTRPAEFEGWRVPDVLLSGDHARIERWRREHVR